MLKKFDWKKYRNLGLRILGYVIVAITLTAIIPIKKSSKYQYTKDKPWQGALLTAPYDFPIYKNEEQLKSEQDSITQALPPVYSLQRDVSLMMMEELRSEYLQRMSDSISSHYFVYVNEQLQKAYEDGIIGLDALNALRSQQRGEVLLEKEGHELEKANVNKFRTLKEVHDAIISNCPPSLQVATLKRMNVEQFLKVNIVYNQEKTELLLSDAISKISPSTGIVQSGQRIIDRGEIVTPHTYDLLQSLEREREKRSGGPIEMNLIRLGILLITLTLLVILSLYLNNVVSRYTPSRKNNILVLSCISIFVLLTALGTYVSVISIYILPYAMTIILLRIFLDNHTAIISYLATILLSALFVTDPLSFILIQVISGMGALINLQHFTNRGQMVYSAFVVFALETITYLGMFLITDGKFTIATAKILIYFGVSLVFLNATYILAAVVEKLFGYVSIFRLVELGDINSPLLKQLSETAPGTFQHSLQVSLLAADATEKIGGDVQLVRTGALYHDIGKMKNPAFFTENQGGMNPHDSYTAVESAGIIIRHVTDGIALAQKHGLPKQIIEFIRTHHSNGLVKYFYITHKNEHQEEEIDLEAFSYPGPQPYTREQGILMLADVTEASSRSLKEYSPESIRAHVNRIIDSIMAEGHLNNTPLTFRDIQTIKEVFISKLQTIYHTRIAYPDSQQQ